MNLKILLCIKTHDSRSKEYATNGELFTGSTTQKFADTVTIDNNYLWHDEPSIPRPFHSLIREISTFI